MTGKYFCSLNFAIVSLHFSYLLVFPLISCSYSPEAALALRRRLNETVEEIDELKKELTSLKVKNEQIDKELTIAKSDRKYLGFRSCLSEATLSPYLS